MRDVIYYFINVLHEKVICYVKDNIIVKVSIEGKDRQFWPTNIDYFSSLIPATPEMLKEILPSHHKEIDGLIDNMIQEM